jgi:phage terminase large subunit-like protein
VLWGFPKGNGKSEIAAAVACCELAGPVSFGGWNGGGNPRGELRISPDIPIGAASFDQADIAFGAAATMIRESPVLAPLFDVYDTEILPKDRPGRLYRVAAVAGTNDGARPSFFVADELHEWMGNKERVHLVLSNNRAKRAGSWELNISTAGFDLQSLLGRLYTLGKRIDAGEKEDDTFLMEWWEPRREFNLGKRRSLLAAIKQANPALGDFLPLQNLLDKFAEGIPEHEFRRYYLNQWTSSPDRWMPADVWSELAAPARKVPNGAAIALGFDGSYNRDSTALWGCTRGDSPHIFKVGVWEQPRGAADWTVNRADVMATIESALARWKVSSLAYDDTFGRIWAMDMESLSGAGVDIVEWPTRAASRMGPACGQFYGACQNGDLSHDDDPTLNRHMANAIGKNTRYGPIVTKLHKDSSERIDAAVAAIIAFDMAIRSEAKGSVYEERGILAI